MPTFFHHLLTLTAARSPESTALYLKDSQLSYAQLNQQISIMASHLSNQGLKPNQRIAVYLPKQFETITSFFAASLAGGVFVPINPLLKSAQVSYILQDCLASVLITSLSRFKQIQSSINDISSIKKIILTDCISEQTPAGCLCWNDLISNNLNPNLNPNSNTTTIEKQKHDVAAILYTSGSTGSPKGVMLSHNNLITGAKSVSQYLENDSKDKLLAVLPFSFDYGLSQLTTAFISGASVVLMEYLLPRDVIRAVAKHKITGLAAVPPLWIQLSELDWPKEAQQSLRYFTNSGGAMPQTTLNNLIQKLPSTSPFLMYGLTEAFRSTYLNPKEISNRPTSIGKAIPYAEILIINSQGKECQAGEEGELVHLGELVSLGYWNAPEKTAKHFKILPMGIKTKPTNEIAVWSGDTVVKDEQGFLYFVGRKDDMIKSSGYRISPSEVEDCVYQHGSVSEVAVIGISHPNLGQAVVLVVVPIDEDSFNKQELLKHCQKNLPNFMQPKSIQLKQMLPRNPNGKINRKWLAKEFAELFKPVK